MNVPKTGPADYFAERQRLSSIMIAASKVGARLFRNVTGMGYIGRIERREGSTITIRQARVLHAGLVKGGSDLIGWTPVVITSAMVGQTVAVFTAIEEKKAAHVKDGRKRRDGKTSGDQDRFIQAVTRAGGIAGVARSKEDALRILCAR